MTSKIVAAALLAGTLAIAPCAAMAQDAAETAAILSGSSQTGNAQRSLGRSIAGSINSANNAIAAQNARATGVRAQGTPRRAQRGGVKIGHDLPAGVDVLAGTDAATYRLGNGSSIRTTGRLNTDNGSVCVRNCENAAAVKP